MAVLGVLAGCSCGLPPIVPASCGAGYRGYDLGAQFDGFNLINRQAECAPGLGKSMLPGASASIADLTIPTAPIPFVSVLYGPCNATAGAPSCGATLEIQSWPECRRNLASYSRGVDDAALNPIVDVSTPRLPAASFDGGTRVELYTGTTTIVVFSDLPSMTQGAVIALERQIGAPGPFQTLRRKALDPRLACGGQLSGAAVAFGSAATAQDNFTQSTDCPKSHPVDPINIVWAWSNVTSAQVGAELTDRLHWWYNDEWIASVADHQKVTTACKQESDQQASSCPVCDRYHIRLFDVAAGANAYVVGDAHFDSDSFFGGCSSVLWVAGHVSSSFNTPRKAIAQGWGASAGAHLAYWGNTRRQRQCDGSTPWSDGYVLEEGQAASPSPALPSTVPALALIPTTRGQGRAATTFHIAPLAARPAIPSLVQRRATTVSGALDALRTAVARHDIAAICSLLIPVTGAQSAGLRPDLVNRDIASCLESFGPHSGFAELQRGLEGVRLAPAPITRFSATGSGSRPQANAVIVGPHLPPGATGSFVQFGGLWRLAFAPN